MTGEVVSVEGNSADRGGPGGPQGGLLAVEHLGPAGGEHDPSVAGLDQPPGHRHPDLAPAPEEEDRPVPDRLTTARPPRRRPLTRAQPDDRVS